jgi:hypothetical protein
VRTFFRENLMIIVSIALPLLVAIFFALATVLPGLFAASPQHDLLLSLHGRSTDRTSELNIKFAVENGQVRVLAIQPEIPHTQDIPRLFRYDHAKNKVTEIAIPLPADTSGFEQETAIAVPELEDLKVVGTLVAPDGYEFRGRRRSGGLMMELFGASRNRTDVSIARNGSIRRIRLPASDYWYNDIRFLGWVIEKGDTNARQR